VHCSRCVAQVIRAVKTKLVALTVLRRKGKFVEHLFEGGLIEQKDYDLLTVHPRFTPFMLRLTTFKGNYRTIDFVRGGVILAGLCLLLGVQTAIIRQSTRLSLGGWNTNDMPEPKDLMYHHHMFNNMSRDVFDKEVLPHAIHRVFREKEHIFRKGDSPTSFFMIIRGSTISCALRYTLPSLTTHTRARAHKRTHAHINTRQSHTQTQAHTHTRARAHRHAHTHTHTHTSARAHNDSRAYVNNH
jgi:hypothetical protein